MQARDLMTTDVIAVKADESVRNVAQLLLGHRISAVPVIDADGRVVGMVSEGDLIRRADGGAEGSRSWWLDLLATPEVTARDYVKSHATQVKDVMTRNVIAVDEDTPIAKVATLLEEKQIKRVPVTRNGELVGIISRADLLRAIATATVEKPAPADGALRRDVMKRVRSEAGVRDWLMNVTVSNGIVHLWGGVRSEDERQAARVAAENVGGVKGVEDHLTVVRTGI